MNLGSAHRSHVLRVRSFGCALSVSKLAAPSGVYIKNPLAL
ncbi:DNA metabolism protein [Salmonella enterica]|nr:DNA metabolism protein [Salmonella enterica]